MKTIKYLGKSKVFTLKPPLVAESTSFDEKNKWINEVSNEEAAKLLSENPRTFKEVPEIPPEKLTKDYLEKKSPEEIEGIVVKRFGEDLDRRHEKPELIKQALEIQKKVADETKKAAAAAKKKADAEAKKAAEKKAQAENSKDAE